MPAFQGKRVSQTWAVILEEAATHIRFQLNSGQRTLAEQRALYAQNMYPDGSGPRPGHPLTAVPRPTAPHIREGHQNHCLDVEPSDGGEQRLQNWVQARGVPLVNNVSGESWHLDPTDEAKLKALAKNILATRYVQLGSKGDKQRAVKHKLVTLGYMQRVSAGGFGKAAVAALKRFQRDHHLAADGVAGPLTLEAINAALKRRK